MKYFYLVVLTLILSLTGCGYKEGVSTSAPQAYLYFTGPTEGVLVSIDEGDSFPIQAGINNQYTIEPGKHTVKIYRSGTLIIDRNIYVGNGISKEIEVH